jgi:hypothetical protein
VGAGVASGGWVEAGNELPDDTAGDPPHATSVSRPIATDITAQGEATP